MFTKPQAQDNAFTMVTEQARYIGCIGQQRFYMLDGCMWLITGESVLQADTNEEFQRREIEKQINVLRTAPNRRFEVFSLGNWYALAEDGALVLYTIDGMCTVPTLNEQGDIEYQEPIFVYNPFRATQHDTPSPTIERALKKAFAEHKYSNDNYRAATEQNEPTHIPLFIGTDEPVFMGSVVVPSVADDRTKLDVARCMITDIQRLWNEGHFDYGGFLKLLIERGYEVNDGLTLHLSCPTS